MLLYSYELLQGFLQLFQVAAGNPEVEELPGDGRVGGFGAAVELGRSGLQEVPDDAESLAAIPELAAELGSVAGLNPLGAEILADLVE